MGGLEVTIVGRVIDSKHQTLRYNVVAAVLIEKKICKIYRSNSSSGSKNVGERVIDASFFYEMLCDFEQRVAALVYL